MNYLSREIIEDCELSIKGKWTFKISIKRIMVLKASELSKKGADRMHKISREGAERGA